MDCRDETKEGHHHHEGISPKNLQGSVGNHPHPHSTHKFVRMVKRRSEQRARVGSLLLSSQWQAVTEFHRQRKTVLMIQPVEMYRFI